MEGRSIKAKFKDGIEEGWKVVKVYDVVDIRTSDIVWIPVGGQNE